MRYALVSDIHANLPALEAVLGDIAVRAPESPVYHLGDLVGYVAWPNEDFLRKMATALGTRTGDVICFGHTHIAWHRAVDGVHFVNTGSVGRMQAIRDSDLPGEFADQLAAGTTA